MLTQAVPRHEVENYMIGTGAASRLHTLKTAKGRGWRANQATPSLPTPLLPLALRE